MRVLIINGPNLNMLGIRQPEIYGYATYFDLVRYCHTQAEDLGIDLVCFQSNHEGEIIDKIQDAYKKFDGIIINAGAYTHYSYAIKDALNLVKIPKVEVHISNIYEREEFRKISVIKDECDYSIVGQGIKGYLLAIDYLRK